MTTFRIVPRQHTAKQSGQRYGFVIPNHPLGITKTAGAGFPVGSYLASWDTFDEAVAAALCVGLDPYSTVESVSVFVPDC